MLCTTSQIGHTICILFFYFSFLFCWLLAHIRFSSMQIRFTNFNEQQIGNFIYLLGEFQVIKRDVLLSFSIFFFLSDSSMKHQFLCRFFARKKSIAIQFYLRAQSKKNEPKSMFQIAEFVVPFYGRVIDTAMATKNSIKVKWNHIS